MPRCPRCSCGSLELVYPSKDDPSLLAILALRQSGGASEDEMIAYFLSGELASPRLDAAAVLFALVGSTSFDGFSNGDIWYAFGTFSSLRQSITAQQWMLVVMVAFTCLALWILSAVTTATG